MNLSDKAYFLSQVSIFGHLDERDLLRLADVSEEESVPANQELFKQGQPGDALYVILSGQAGIFLAERHINTLQSKDYIGEIAVLDGSTRTASCKALSDLYLLKVSRTALQTLMTNYSAIRLAVIAELGERLNQINARIHKA